MPQISINKKKYLQIDLREWMQVIRLFLAPEITVKPGSKVTVTQEGVTADYKCSGVRQSILRIRRSFLSCLKGRHDMAKMGGFDLSGLKELQSTAPQILEKRIRKFLGGVMR